MRINQPNLAELAFSDSVEGAERPGATGGAGATSSSGTPSFADEIAGFVTEVAQQGQVAELESEQLARGQGNVHETALALEKADVEMRLLMKGRNKIIEAYQEISRMPV